MSTFIRNVLNKKNLSNVTIFGLFLFAQLLIVRYFYNRFWWPQDDGIFAHAAQCLWAGKVLTRDIQEIHPGYLDFINAAAFKIWGLDFLSLRWPLMAVMLLSSILVYCLFAKRDCKAAVIASFVPSTLGILQFLNPNHHWYVYFLAIVTIVLLVKFPEKTNFRLILLGILIGLVFFLRQLSAVFLAMGVLCFLLIPSYEENRESHSPLARFFIFLLFAGTAGYLWKTTNFTGFLLFGLAPLILLLWLGRKVRIDNRTFINLIINLIFGFFIAALPLIGYHLYHGTIGLWLNDIFVVSTATVWNQSFLSWIRFDQMIGEGILNCVREPSLGVILNGFFWTVLPFFPLLNAFLLFQPLKEEKKDSTLLALPFVAVFFNLVSLHNQIPCYLFFSVGLAVLGVLWMALEKERFFFYFSAGMISVLCIIALYFQAGQPLQRDFVKGERLPLVYAGDTIDRLHLWIDETDKQIYGELVSFIRTHSQQGDKIFAFPNNAELYFLSDRQSLFRFYSTDERVRNGQDLKHVLNYLSQSPPKILIDKPVDKRHTFFSRQIESYIRQNFRYVKRIGWFDIYEPIEPTSRN